MKVYEAFKKAVDLLSQIEDREYATWESLVILSYLLDTKPLSVYLFLEKEIPEEQFLDILSQRLTKKPLPYILGETYFWGRKFFIEEGVLIPRQDTELLVEVFLSLGIEEGEVLEIGIGTGVVILTLLLEKPKLRGIGIDLSPKALSLTKKNAMFYGVAERLLLIRGDAFKPLAEKKIFRAIVSNPPYLSEREWNDLEEDIKLFEPKEALVAGEKGWEFHEMILRAAHRYLREDGFLILELGYNQRKDIEKLAYLYKWSFSFYKDLRNYDRVVVLWKA